MRRISNNTSQNNKNKTPPNNKNYCNLINSLITTFRANTNTHTQNLRSEKSENSTNFVEQNKNGVVFGMIRKLYPERLNLKIGGQTNETTAIKCAVQNAQK